MKSGSKRDSASRRCGALLTLFVFAPCVMAKAGVVAVPTPSVFVEVDRFRLSGSGNHHDLAFDGNQWRAASGLRDFWWNYDSNFQLLGTTTVSGVFDMRGLDYIAATNQIILSDNTSWGEVFLVASDGSVSSQFRTDRMLQGLDYDDRDGTFWVGFGGGTIQLWSLAGDLLTSYTAGALVPVPTLGWTGIAINPIRNSIYVMEFNDAIYEFTLSGEYVGQVLDDPFPSANAFDGNGLGLHFDVETRLLRATSQTGEVAVFWLVPEPSSLILFLIALFPLTVRSRVP